MAELNSKGVLSMLGDWLRDASVLVLVFFPLEMSGKGQNGISLPLLLIISCTSLTLLVMGIAFEKFEELRSLRR